MAEKLKTESEIFYLELCNDCNIPNNSIMYVDMNNTINTPNAGGILFTFRCALYNPLSSIDIRQILLSNDKIYKREHYSGSTWNEWK